jgi:hypothetical protein
VKSQNHFVMILNAYAEPVMSLDLDIVIASEKIEMGCTAVGEFLKIEHFEHSINLSSKKSDLRIQLQTDSRYQNFVSRAKIRTILGYKMKVASVEDVLHGKTWASLDEQRRGVKRQKDLAAITRLIEFYPNLVFRLPEVILNKIE